MSTSSRRQVLLVGDTSARSNWGCRATSGALRKLIEERASISGALDVHRLYEPVPLTNTFTPAGAGGAPLLRRVVRRADRALTGVDRERARWKDVNPDTLEAFATAVEKAPAFRHLRAAISAADVVIVNGEGSILQDRAGGRKLLAVAYAARTRFARPVAIVNHTADLRSGMAPMANAVYPRVDDIRVRELHSLRELEPVAGNVPLSFAADAAFSGRAKTAIQRDRPVIVLGGSAAYRTSGDNNAELVRAYKTLAQKLGGLGDVVVTAASTPDDSFLEPVATELGLPYYGLDTPTVEAEDLLSSADLYVGGRWHPAILATKGAVPIVVFESNSRNKISGLLELLGSDQGHLSALDLDIPRIVELAKQRLGDPETASLREKATELSSSSRENVSILA